jgi:hypothetical protein
LGRNLLAGAGRMGYNDVLFGGMFLWNGTFLTEVDESRPGLIGRVKNMIVTDSSGYLDINSLGFIRYEIRNGRCPAMGHCQACSWRALAGLCRA